MLKRSKLARVGIKRAIVQPGRKPIKKGVTGQTSGNKRKPKTPEAKLKAELWELCKKITRTRHGNTCYTCEAPNLVGSNWHTGHFIPSSICGLYLRYDLRNLRPQCFRCNISLSGNGSAFYRKLVDDCGQPYVDTIFSDKLRDTKSNKAFYQTLIDEYKTILSREYS